MANAAGPASGAVTKPGLRWADAAAWALILSAPAAQLWRVAGGGAPPAWDDAWYLEESFRLFDAARSGPLAFLAAYADAFRFKAPLIAVLPLPLFALFGKTQASALALNALVLLALGAYVRLLGRRFAGGLGGLLALALLHTMPLLYGLSRLFYVEPLLTLCVAAYLHHLLASEGLQRRPHVFALGVALGAGLLTKVLFPLYVLCPSALHLRDLRKRGGLPGSRSLESAAKTVLGLGGALALTWYAFNWPYVAGFALKSGLGELGAPYGDAPFYSLAARWSYLDAAARHGVSYYYAAAAPLLLLALALPDGLRAGAARLLRNDAFRFLGAWVFPALLFLAFQRIGEVRYILPLLPGAAVGLAAGLAQLFGGTPWRIALLAAFFAFPADLFAARTFGFSLLPHPLSLAYNALPALGSSWDKEAVLEELGRIQKERGEPLVVAVALEHPAFNANNLACLAAQRGLPVSFMNLGHAQASAEAALIRMKEKGVTHLLSVTGVPEAELSPAFNRVNAQALELAPKRGLFFRPSAELIPRPGVRAVLHERVPAPPRAPFRRRAPSTPAGDTTPSRADSPGAGRAPPR